MYDSFDPPFNPKDPLDLLVSGMPIAIILFLLVGLPIIHHLEDRQTIADARENTAEVIVCGVVYVPPDTSAVLVKGGSPALGAILGGGGAKLLGCGPLGIIAGSAIGAEATTCDPHYRKIATREEKLYLQVRKGDDTLFLDIRWSGWYATDSDPVMRPDSPSLYQMYQALNPGGGVRLVSNEPVSKLDKLTTKQIFFPGEQIPYFD